MKKLSYFPLIALLAFVGCKKDDNPTTPQNHAPTITSVTASPDSIGLGGSTTVSCVAMDADRDAMTYVWSCPSGAFPSGVASASVVWQGPNTAGSYTVQVTVSDGALTASSSANVKVGVPRTGSISGRITDTVNGNPIAGATVMTQPATASTTTDAQGRYTLSDVPPASYIVSASKAGYQGNSVQVAVTAGNTATANIALSVSQGGHAGEERDFPMGATTIRMCWIPAGNFQMGRTPGEQDSYIDEDPRHQVTFANGFWLGKTEITQAQWQAVMGNNPSYFRGDDNLPVERVSWDDIQGFESALHDSFRLASESEWEYACRAGTTTRFYWGDDPNYSEIGSYAWHYGNSNNTTHPVGTKTANAWGLCDMSGNVWEWCEDWYHESYRGAPSDGSAWVAGGGDWRVLRGGSWNDYLRDCRSAYRAGPDPRSRTSIYGFRVAAGFSSP